MPQNFPEVPAITLLFIQQMTEYLLIIPQTILKTNLIFLPE